MNVVLSSPIYNSACFLIIHLVPKYANMEKGKKTLSCVSGVENSVSEEILF